MPIFPVSNLPKEVSTWRIAVEKNINQLSTDSDRRAQGEVNTGKATNGTLKALSNQIGNLATAQAETAAAQAATATAQAATALNTALLLAIAQRNYAEFTTGTTGTSGFYPPPATVTINSPTGHIELEYGGSLNGGDGYFVYGIKDPVGAIVVDRATVQASPAQRVAVSGGASFAPSGSRSVLIAVPANTLLTVTLEIYGASTFTYFFGGSILARVAP